MEAICLGAKMVASNDRPFYAPVTEEVIKFKKKSYSMVNRDSET